jgi:hypothetical protein
MNKTLISLHYLGNIEYYAKLLQADEIVIEKQEYFIKSTFRNRCFLAGANGIMRLTIPLENGRDHKMFYKNIMSLPNDRWKSIHWHSIVSAYKHAPYFEHYAPYFEKLYLDNAPVNVFDFNLQLLNTTLKILKITTPISFTTSYEKQVDASIIDYRNYTFKSLTHHHYIQVFEKRNGFILNLSILDLIFNLGTQAKQYLVENKDAL